MNPKDNDKSFEAEEMQRPTAVVQFDEERLRPKERIGLFSSVTFVVGAIIGSGIFISPKGAFVNTGSIGLSLIVWLGVGLFYTLTAFVYADLGTMIPRSGGPYIYILEGIGDIPAFLVTWSQTVVGSTGSRAVLALVFADYLCAPIYGSCKPPDSIRKLIAATELISLCIINIISVRFAAATQAFFTVAKVLVLVLIIAIGIVWIGAGNTENLATGFDGSTSSVASIALAAYACYWAYGGVTAVNDISEEIINPKANLPRAIIISMFSIIVIYLTANISYFTLLSKQEFLESSAVAFSTAEKVLGTAAIIIPIGVMFSVYGAANGGNFTNSRSLFAAARQGHLPEMICFLHVKTLIPTTSIIITTILSLLLLIPADIAQLINLTSFVAFIIEGLAMVAHIRLRIQGKRKSSFPVPIIISGISLTMSLFMVIVPLVQDPKIEFLFGVTFVFSGLLFYFPFVYFKLRIPGMDSVTLFTQLFFEVAPTVIPDKL